MYYAMAFSLGVHLAVLFPEANQTDRRVFHGLLGNFLIRSENSNADNPKITSIPALAKTNSSASSKNSVLPKYEENSLSPIHRSFSQAIVLSSELDHPLVFDQELDLEPEAGYPLNLGGNAIFSLIVGEDGAVHTAFISSTTLDASTVQAMLGKLSMAHFNTPTVDGRPVMAFLQLEVILRPEE